MSRMYHSEPVVPVAGTLVHELLTEMLRDGHVGVYMIAGHGRRWRLDQSHYGPLERDEFNVFQCVREVADSMPPMDGHPAHYLYLNRMIATIEMPWAGSTTQWNLAYDRPRGTLVISTTEPPPSHDSGTSVMRRLRRLFGPNH